MSDQYSKRRRFRKPKDERQQQTHRTITIARREHDQPNTSSSQQSTIHRNEVDVVPKILLKPKTLDKEPKERLDEESAGASEINNHAQKTITTIRSDISNASLANSASSKYDSQTEQNSAHSQESVQMTRPATILSSTSVISANVKRLLKENSDFLVVGVIGTQGVGKSTILNLLANEDEDFDYYQKIFVDEDGYFPTKLKQFKNPSRSRTESTHMFITNKDRMILLDIAPVFCNSYKKDMTTNELDDLHTIVNSLSVCHLVIVVYRNYLNMNFLRLLRLAELTKPDYNNYFPNLLFLKNRANRADFSMAAQKQVNDMLEACFKDSKLRIYRGQTSDNLTTNFKHNSIECKPSVNSFVFPDVKVSTTNYHKPLNEIINDLRWAVFTTPRNEIGESGEQLTEIAWFELFEKVTQTQQFFFKTYDEIHRNHFDGGNNVRDMQDNWKE